MKEEDINMKEVIEKLNLLSTLSGNAQIEYLTSIKDEMIRDILDKTYNPHRLYKIDTGKYEKVQIEAPQIKIPFYPQDWEIFKRKLQLLENVKSATDEMVKDMKEFIYQYNEEEIKFLEKVLFKDLRLNMGIKKFQKVWEGFCEEPQVQLAQKLEGQFFINGLYSRKLDGLRTYILDGVAYSRTNKPHKVGPLQHIIEQLNELPESRDFVFDGELIYLKDGIEDFQKAISLARSDKRVEECNHLYYIIFDMIPKEYFISKKRYIPFSDEYALMKKYFNVTTQELSWFRTMSPNILLIRQVTEDDKAELEEARDKYNWEGLMYRDGNSAYEYKRTNKLLKIKAMKDIELKLIGMEEGTGKHEGRLGNFIVDYKGFELKIGSGFSDEQREKYWGNKDKYIGQYVKVKYFEETTNQQGGESLRFPIFLCFRNLDTMEEFT